MILQKEILRVLKVVEPKDQTDLGSNPDIPYQLCDRASYLTSLIF